MTNPLDLFYQESKKRNQLMELAFGGNSSILKLAESQYNIQNKLNALDIFDPQKRINMIINDSFSKNFQNESYKSIERALMPFKSIANITENINKQLETFNSSQILLKSSLELLTKSQNEKLFKGFNPLLPAISEITKSFLKNAEINNNNDFEELEIINTVTDRINEVSENFIEREDTTIDIQTYLVEINDALLGLHQEFTILKPTKKDKWLIYIRDIITLISFFSLFYNPLNTKNDKLILETPKKVNDIDKRLVNIEKIVGKNTDNILLSTSNYKCIKHSDVFLKPDKNSKKIGKINKGQILRIIEVRRKYCCIAILPKNNQDAIVGYMLINNTNFND